MSNVTQEDIMSDAQARALADKYLETMISIKELEAKKADIEEKLRGYVSATGAEQVGNLKAYTRKNPSRLECTLAGKKLDDVLPVIFERIDESYVKRSLDVTKIASEWTHNADLRTILVSQGVRVSEPVEKILFKHI